MKFCSNCDMLFNLVLENNGNKQKLTHICNNCGNKEENDNICIVKINNEDNILTVTDEKLIKNICADITLPRTKHITCPNNDCDCNKVNFNKDKSKENEVVYFIVHHKDMIYQYICCNCYHTWTNR
jgi:hypothetical protein